MERRHLILIVGAIFLATSGIVAACGMEVGDNAGELGASIDPTDPVMPVPAPRMIDAGYFQEVNPQVPSATAETEPPEECGANVCGAGESCCHVDGTCYPSDCLDCCATFDERPAPRIEAPDPTVIPRDDFAGPEGGPLPPPDDSPGMPPGVDRP